MHPPTKCSFHPMVSIIFCFTVTLNFDLLTPKSDAFFSVSIYGALQTVRGTRRPHWNVTKNSHEPMIWRRVILHGAARYQYCSMFAWRAAISWSWPLHLKHTLSVTPMQGADWHRRRTIRNAVCIDIGDREVGAFAPPPLSQKLGNIFPANMVKVGHFVNFSYVYFREKCPPKVAWAPTPMAICNFI